MNVLAFTLSAISMESNLPQYEYRQLHDGEDFRLLGIEPGEGEIVCTLRHAPLQDAPAFEALSYTWGAGDMDHQVICDNYMLSVSQSLHEALAALRLKDRLVIMWIDAICINQQDVNEKNTQVQLMRQIYETARGVIVWLGAADEETSRAFGVIGNLTQSIDEFQRLGGRWTSFVSYFLYNSGMTLDQWINGLTPLAKLLSRPWFLRAWTLQEVVVGPLSVGRVLIFAGGIGCFLTDLVKICECWRMAGMMPFVIIPGEPSRVLLAKLAITQLDCVAKMQRQVQNNNLLDTLSTLKIGRMRQATDPRDKIFGLIGLTKDRDNEALKPDYSLDTQTVYRRFATSHYASTKRFELFSICCQKESTLPELRSMPSWVPDWSENVEHDTFGEVDYHAGGLETQDITFTENCQALNASGVLLDHVQHIGIGIQRDTDPSVEFSELYKNFVQWLDMTSKQKYYPPNTSLPSEEDIWRCLICDRDITGRPAPLTYGQYYREYVRFMHWLDDWNTRCGGVPQQPPQEEATQYSSEGQSMYENSILQWAGTRRFCVTSLGRIGWVPPEAEAGDAICVFIGAATPHLLRLDQDERFRLVGGACYIHGYMEGEALKYVEESIETFTIY